jgi:hypothetical protein
MANKIIFRETEDPVSIISSNIPKGTYYLARGFGFPGPVDGRGRGLFVRNWEGSHTSVHNPNHTWEKTCSLELINYEPVDVEVLVRKKQVEE